jgi:uncharacterized SAM-binding protein YcdF (DUF218 family)
VIAWAAIVRATARQANTSQRTFDAIIVLGTPSDDDGNPSPVMQDRVGEGVREYQRGVAPRIVFTGAAAHNRFVEAQVMAQAAEAQGVPRSQIFEEPQALDTIQNACYSARILASHGWRSAEVVSSASHLPRASLIFSKAFSDQPGGTWRWKMHASPGTLTSKAYERAATVAEVLKTARYLVWSRWVEHCPA